MVVMRRRANCSSGSSVGLLTLLLVMSMIQIAASHSKRNHDEGVDKIRSPRNTQLTRRTNAQSSSVCSTSECVTSATKIKSSMNLTANPCDNFYEYACGKWAIANPPPPGSSYYSMVDIADSESEKYKKRKLETATIRINGASSEVEKLPSDLYKSCMNLTTIENLGAAPLKDRIKELGGWTLSGKWNEKTWNFEKTLLAIHKTKPRKGPVFRVKVTPDGILIFQAGPTLSKSQYLDLTSKTILAYKKLIVDVAVLLGVDRNTAATKADEIINFEAKLASASLSIPEWIASQSKNITLAQLQRDVSQFDWSDYLNKLFAPVTVPSSEVIGMPTLSYLKKAMKLIHSTPKSVLANYLVWNVIMNDLDWLSTPFRKANKKFLQAAWGSTASEPRWKTCVKSAFYDFDDIISAAYVNDHKVQLTRPRNMSKTIFNEAVDAFKQNVNSLTWLDDETKTQIYQKVDSITTKISYPDYMLDSTKIASLFAKYQGLTLSKDKYFKNQVDIRKREKQELVKSFKKPKDDSLWIPSPLHAIAIYDSEDNILTLPAAILQEPFVFPYESLRSYNLGNLGSVIGYQVLHGFTNTGRSSWSDHSRQGFAKKVKCYENQYSGYRILGKWPINGKATAEENVADNGGLKIALKAYYNWANKHPTKTQRLQGLNQLTNEQLFYIGYAQKHCAQIASQIRYNTNLGGYPFADHEFRVIVPLANSLEFSNAFGCTTNTNMNPAKKCYLWSKAGRLV